MEFYSLKHQAAQVMMPLHTDLDHLTSDSCGIHSVIPYHDYVVFAWDVCRGLQEKEASYAVYKFDQSPDYKYDYESPLSLVFIMPNAFDHIGPAAKEGILRAEMLRSDDLMKRKV